MGVLLGLTGAVCWGMADFAARFASRRVGAYRTLFFMQFFGFLALSVYLKFTGGFSHVAPGWQPWALTVAAGLINVIASLSLYHSFEIGVMSIVGPVSSSYPALTVALSLASGERIHALRGIGMAVTFTGVILAAMSFASKANDASHSNGASVSAYLSRGVGWAILAAVGFGFMFWFLGFHVVPLVGDAVSVWVMRLTALVSLAVFALPARQNIRPPHGGVWWMLAAVGLMDTAAFVANNAGLHIGPVSVVSVLASLYGAVTVLLSWIFLRERLERSQWLGIVLIFIGVVCVSI
ncbi:MAG TPA: DMT family transporter [Candidatus Acidoferrales bacterium]|nr:DMT family transporter [Candidatus Acidoferrales bacterium]